MKKLNNLINSTNTNNQNNRSNNVSSQSQSSQNDSNIINRESKQTNNISKKNVFPTKKRAISTEKDDIYSKKLGKKIESARSRSNLVENQFYEEDYSNIGKTKVNVSVLEFKPINPDNNNNFNEVHTPKNLDVEVSDEIKKILKTYLELSAAVNKKAHELNQKNMEVKKKLTQKFLTKKISVYELELLREYSENIADGSEQIKRRKRIELEEKEKLLALKKIKNDKVLKLQENLKAEKEKQERIQEEYTAQIKDAEARVNYCG